MLRIKEKKYQSVIRQNRNRVLGLDKKTGGIFLSLEITHICNKNCAYCDHRIRSSDYKFMTDVQLEKIISAMEGYKIDTLQIMGGEPLCYPHLEEFIKKIRQRLKPCKLIMTTNGVLLDRLPEKILNSFHKIKISEYPGFNDKIIPKFKNRKNVAIYEYNGFWNPYKNPKLDEKTAKRISNICPYRYYTIRVVGDRIYDCCRAEGVERYYGTGKVHCLVNKDWGENYKRLETWRACQNCFEARWVRQELKYGKFVKKLSMNFDRLYNEMLLRPNGFANSLKFFKSEVVNAIKLGMNFCLGQLPKKDTELSE